MVRETGISATLKNQMFDASRIRGTVSQIIFLSLKEVRYYIDVSLMALYG
jgi:hypothetical protein